MKQFLILIFSSVLFFASCQEVNHETNPPSFRTEIRDTINSHIPIRIRKEWEKADKMYLAQWPLYPIEKGVDTFELRLSFSGIKVAYQPNFYAIKRVDSSVFGCHIFSLKPNDSVLIVHFTPKCGWKLFMDSLSFYGIYTIPSQREIKGFVDNICDGQEAILEYATNKLYRRIVYHEPEYFGDSINKKFWAFLMMWNRNIPTFDISEFEQGHLNKHYVK